MNVPFAALASHLDNLGDRVWMLSVSWCDTWCATACEIQSLVVALGALGLTSALNCTAGAGLLFRQYILQFVF